MSPASSCQTSNSRSSRWSSCQSGAATAAYSTAETFALGATGASSHSRRWSAVRTGAGSHAAYKGRGNGFRASGSHASGSHVSGSCAHGASVSASRGSVASASFYTGSFYGARYTSRAGAGTDYGRACRGRTNNANTCAHSWAEWRYTRSY